MADWRVAYLSALGAKPTPGAMKFLAQWQPWEGGATHNNASYNYFNTEQTMPGSHAVNSVGVQAYPSLAVGARAFAKTLMGRAEYAPLVNFLKTGQGDPTPGLEEWVSGKTNGNPAYAAKILGSHVGNFPTTPAPTTSPTSPTSLGIAPDAAQNAASQAQAVRQQAGANFGLEASGQMTPLEGLTGLTSFIHNFKATVPTIHPVALQAAKADPTGLDAQAVNLAKKYIGVNYQWGGTSAKTGFDCSGLVQTVWKSLGVNIPRTTYAQWDAGTPVSQGQLKAGDEVFFTGSDPMNGKPGHEGMYIGNGKFIEAPGTGMQVRISTLAGRNDYVGARRFG